ncbi:hypothetical protein M0805_002225 [Coniferiporia weirii]|nr:hypothetical protein M0805_002225 [Coniferiporia weirii]
MDQALDDLIKKKHTGPKRGGMRRPRHGGSVRQVVLGKTPADAAATKAVRKAAVAGKPAAAASAAEKIMVSGLPTDVNEAQIRELFLTTVGPLKEIQLQYNPQGKWNGSAIVQFSRKGDGTKAYEAYNNRLIDGKKPMRIEIMYDPSKVPPPSLASRVAPAPAAANGGASGEGAQRSGGRPKRGRGGGKRNVSRPQKSVADLDAEMEDYTASTSTPTAAAPAA